MMAALKGEEILAELGKLPTVHLHGITAWKQHLQKGPLKWAGRWQRRRRWSI